MRSSWYGFLGLCRHKGLRVREMAISGTATPFASIRSTPSLRKL